jgi:membrane protein YqaA with SNARE-associated domain
VNAPDPVSSANTEGERAPMFRRLYERILSLAGGPWALPALAAVAFAESSFFPLPPDALLAPMVLARRERAWLYALVTTVGSVVGGLFGYAIGYFLAPLGIKLLALMGHAGGLASFQQWYAHFGLWVILIKGLTPIPYKLVTIASGLAKFNVPMFIAASIATRGARFFLEAALLQHPQAKALVDRHLNLVIVLAVLAVIAAVVAVKLIG